jgi:hypothetical protein
MLWLNLPLLDMVWTRGGSRTTGTCSGPSMFTTLGFPGNRPISPANPKPAG